MGNQEEHNKRFRCWVGRYHAHGHWQPLDLGIISMHPEAVLNCVYVKSHTSHHITTDHHDRHDRHDHVIIRRAGTRQVQEIFLCTYTPLSCRLDSVFQLAIGLDYAWHGLRTRELAHAHSSFLICSCGQQVWRGIETLLHSCSRSAVDALHGHRHMIRHTDTHQSSSDGTWRSCISSGQWLGAAAWGGM